MLINIDGHLFKQQGGFIDKNGSFKAPYTISGNNMTGGFKTKNARGEYPFDFDIDLKPTFGEMENFFKAAISYEKHLNDSHICAQNFKGWQKLLNLRHYLSETQKSATNSYPLPINYTLVEKTGTINDKETRMPEY